MSPQHDWLKALRPDPEASAEAEAAGVAQADGVQVKADVGRGEKTDGGSASVDGDSVGEASSAGESDQPAQAAGADSPADAAAGERDSGGWSGRAVGPLSGLLPGAVELHADELPAEPAAPEVAVADTKPVSSDAGEASPAALPDETVEVKEEPELSPSATDDRWHAVLVGFVDDPRGSAEAARALIDEDIATHLALLARRKEAMHAAWDASKDADTEALRVTLVSYRNLRMRLADVLDTLAGS